MCLLRTFCIEWLGSTGSMRDADLARVLPAVQGEWVCPTCVYEGHAPAPSPTKQRKSRGRFAAPQVLLEGLSMEELAEAAADPLLGKAQRKAARAQLREEKRRLKEEKVMRFAAFAFCLRSILLSTMLQVLSSAAHSHAPYSVVSTTLHIMMRAGGCEGGEEGSAGRRRGCRQQRARPYGDARRRRHAQRPPRAQLLQAPEAVHRRPWGPQGTRCCCRPCVLDTQQPIVLGLPDHVHLQSTLGEHGPLGGGDAMQLA